MRYIVCWLLLAKALLSQSLEVSVPGKPIRSLTASELNAIGEGRAEMETDGIKVVYRGVWLHDLLKAAGAPAGTELRGRALASYVIAEAEDGYQAVFSLAEIDPAFTDAPVLLATSADGKPLANALGPFRLVATKDKRGARSVRMLKRIEVVQLRKPVALALPLPFEPGDNVATPARVELGRHLFYDMRLSANGKQACASCHIQSLAFTDGRARGLGSTGELHPRSSMSLVNVSYAPALTWNDAGIRDLEQQARVPLFGKHPVELGLSESDTAWLERLERDPIYQRLFRESGLPIAVDVVTRALAAFERSIVSTRSAYDRYRFGGEVDAVSEAVKRGERLFFSSEKAGCFQCHGGWNFAGPVRHRGNAGVLPELPNMGLGQGKFRAPTLRNIALTAPYMHDGRFGTLAEVLEHYVRGGGSEGGQEKSPILRPLSLKESEKSDLLAFLESLSDMEMTLDPRWSNPWVDR